MKHQRNPAAFNLFKGLDDLADRQFGGRYGSKTAALSLGSSGSEGLSGFVDALFEPLQLQWAATLASSPRGSAENFRSAPQLEISPRNKSPEVTLERALVRACRSNGREWWNQMPLISGICGPHAYKKRAVDLVHKHPDGCLELVELKVGSNTPLLAAIEVLTYGFLWLLSRRDRAVLGYDDRPMLDPSALQLTVLAPRQFYQGYQIAECIAVLDSGVASLGRSFGVEMRLRQMAFPEAFQWRTGCTDSELLEMLDGRELV